MRRCKEKGIKAHPARFPAALPEYLIRMTTDPGDMALDPFGGSCITDGVAERLGHSWVCAELIESYLEGARGRSGLSGKPSKPKARKNEEDGNYRIPHPDMLWNGGNERETAPSPADGYRQRPECPRGPKPEDVTFIEAAEQRLPPSSKRVLLVPFQNALSKSGLNFLRLTMEGALRQPTGTVKASGSFRLRVYIWNLTPGGKNRPGDE